MHLGAVLYVYKGDNGLPTIDFECLRAMCLVKFTRFPAKIDTTGNPMHSINGKLPYLQVGNEKFTGYRQIKDFLDNECFPIDKGLPRKPRCLSGSYTEWVFNELHGYYNYFMYCDPINYEKTRSLYAKHTKFPLNFYYPTTYAKEAKEIVLTMFGIDVLSKVDKYEIDIIVKKAILCINKLSKKLLETVWFFGNTYSELDAIVYSYLSILLNIDLPNNPIAMHIKGHKNLKNFISRITRDLFREETFDLNKNMRTAIQKNPRHANSETSFLATERSVQVVAGLIAVFAMSAFAAWRKLNKKTNYLPRAQYGYEMDDDEEDEEDADL